MKARKSNKSNAASVRSRLRLERYPLPKTTEDICSQIREILKGRNVVHLELSIDNPIIRVMRQVTSEELEEDSVTWDIALQSIENMIEYSSEGASAYQVLVDLLQLVSAEELHALRWITGAGGTQFINQWLEVKERGMPRHNGLLLGLPIMEITSLPMETLVLCAAQWPNAGPEEVSFAVKTVMELIKHEERRSDTSSKTIDPVGDIAGKYASTVEGLALTARGLRRVPW